MESFPASLVAGQRLSERLKPRSHLPNVGSALSGIPGTEVEKQKNAALPKCPMIYAMIGDMSLLVEVPPVMPSGPPFVQPGMTGVGTEQIRLPALLPLDLVNVSLNVECHISTGFVTVEGVWNLGFLKTNRQCDCVLAVPMHRQGTVAGVEIDLGDGRLYATLIVPKDEASNYGAHGSSGSGIDDPGTYNPELFRLFFPKVLAGSNLSLKITWFQAMEFADGLYSIRVPFEFPEHVLPMGELIPNVTKVTCTINSGTKTPVEVGKLHQSLKETVRDPGHVVFVAGSALTPDGWRNGDLVASYKVWSDGILPNLIVQDPIPGDLDPRGVFCLSVSPPDPKSVQGFQRAVVFLVDRSGSMDGKPMNDARDALRFGLASLQTVDFFNIIAFDHELLFFSSQLVPANGDAIRSAYEWISTSCESRGGTDILSPLQQALQMLQNIQGYVPYIFLITDGAVHDERNICRLMQNALAQGGSAAPRISTFGIGHYCNYYFLKMLALIGRGLSDVAFSSDNIRGQMEKMLVAASTPLLTNIKLAIDVPGGYETYPYPIPDLFCGNPLVVSGRFHGKFPKSIKIVGLLPNQSVWEIQVEMQKCQHIPLAKVFARQQLDLITAQSWLTEDIRLQNQAVNLSVAAGIPCEYTRMISFETTKVQHESLKQDLNKGKKVNLKKYGIKAAKIAIVGGLVIGFGSIAATAANLAIGDVFDIGGDWMPDFGDIGDAFSCDCCGCDGCDGCDACDLCSSLFDNCDDCDCGDLISCTAELLCTCVAGLF